MSTETSTPKPRASRVGWIAFGVAAAFALLFFVTTVAVGASKAVPVAGPAVTVSATPLPAKTVTVVDENQITALRAQLQACDAAWREIAGKESDALGKYNQATQAIVRGVQNYDSSELDSATSTIEDATAIVDEITPKVTTAHSTCIDGE